MTHWAHDAIFYHIYPLGLCGAPQRNDFHSPAQPRLDRLHVWVDHIAGLGANAVYLGPLFESTSHGYDTVDYYHVDRRLGDNRTLARLADALHARGLRLILDGVFNHVGRDFWALADVRQNGPASPYCGWFQGLDFGRASPYGDPFVYQGWNGCLDLVKLNLHHPAVREHLLGAVEAWVREYGIDGLRLDAADCVELGFLRELAAFCRRLRPDFWLVGEIIHGDYRTWANPQTLDAVTNYECYKGLYSSHNDRNYHEIAYALNRQFGAGGLYTGLPLYAFADNHDVSRVASILHERAHLYPLYCLLLTMPGAPSVYYGSEWGVEGVKVNGSDWPLRPSLDLAQVPRENGGAALESAIARLAKVRHASNALRRGDYRQLEVRAEQLAFVRQAEGETVIVAVNGADAPAEFDLEVPGRHEGALADLLNPGEIFGVSGGRAQVEVRPHWARILQVAA
jgi:glycosidase